MDLVLSDNLRKYIFAKTYSDDEFFNSYINPVNSWLPIIDQGRLYLTLNFKGVKCDSDTCRSTRKESILRFNKDNLISSLQFAIFSDQHDNFYIIDMTTFDDNVLELSIEPIDPTFYLDVIPEEMKMIILSYLGKTDLQSVIKIKNNFIINNNIFWQRLAGYRYPKYFKLIDDELIKHGISWSYIYPHLLDFVNVRLSQFFDSFSIDTRILTTYDVLTVKILKWVKLKIMYPYLYDLVYPNEKAIGIFDWMIPISPLFNTYYRTGILSDDYVFNVNINIVDDRYLFDPKITYDFINNPNFKYSKYPVPDLYYILTSLLKNKELFRKYILKLYQENIDLLDSLYHTMPHNAYLSEYDNIIKAIGEVVTL